MPLEPNPPPAGPVQIRNETQADWRGVDRVERLAFGRPDEADLVTRLRTEGLVEVALVAEAATAIVGHLLLTRLPVQVDGRPIHATALAPLAVLPAYQRRGVGAALVHAGIAAARRQGQEAIIVLGDPSYYGRFGFSSAAAAILAAPFEGPAFMALELAPGALHGRSGRVDYPTAFGIDRAI